VAGLARQSRPAQCSMNEFGAAWRPCAHATLRKLRCSAIVRRIMCTCPRPRTKPVAVRDFACHTRHAHAHTRAAASPLASADASGCCAAPLPDARLSRRLFDPDGEAAGVARLDGSERRCRARRASGPRRSPSLIVWCSGHRLRSDGRCDTSRGRGVWRTLQGPAALCAPRGLGVTLHFLYHVP
jgi:hypothetical protein